MLAMMPSESCVWNRDTGPGLTSSITPANTSPWSGRYGGRAPSSDSATGRIPGLTLTLHPYADDASIGRVQAGRGEQGGPVIDHDRNVPRAGLGQVLSAFIPPFTRDLVQVARRVLGVRPS